mgnify:CR=1 FL=1
MVAGEPSGDLLAGHLLDGLRARWPGLQAIGIGGPEMLKRGFETWWPQDLLAVRGYAEVLPRLFQLLSVRRELGARLLASPPDVFIGIDAPDFNFGLEARLKAGGIRTVHFVSPSFWAWRAGKLAKLKAGADHVLCIFPFEPALLAQHGIAATYVGHPLAGVIPIEPDRLSARAALGLAPDGPVVALLPGSRASEIRYLAARFLAAAVQILNRRPGTRFVLPTLPGLRPAVELAAKASGLGDSLLIVNGQSQRALEACDVTLIASGTATLEAALFKRPMVIAYNMNWLSWHLMRHRNLQPWVGLPNILCRDFVVPELLQDAATPQALAAGILDWMGSPQKAQALGERFMTLHHELRRDTAKLATDAIEEVLAR